MEVEAEILEKLVCDYCGEYLAIGPVMLLEEEKSVCGRCYTPDPKEQTVLRNLPYELLAKNLLFPCQYKRYGCTTKQRFNSLKSHEAACDFRQYSCFLLETKSCNWFGAKKYILDHCRTKHPDLVVTNPAIIEHNVAQRSVKNFLMAAFNMLFLIHTKVCLETKKIYHSVRLLGDVGNADDYGYTLDISKERNLLSKSGNVSPQGCLTMKKNESVELGINSLMEILGGYTGTAFKLTVISFVKETVVEPQVLLEFKQISKTNCNKELSCNRCQRIITDELIYYDKGKRNCIDCINNKHECEFKQNGCTFMSTYNKSYIHSWYYCIYRNTCIICSSIFGDSIDSHYDIAHADITRSAGVAFTEQINRNEHKTSIITSDIGKLHCVYTYNASWFTLSICSPIDSGDLHNYALQLKLQNPQSGYILQKNIPIYDNVTDWFLEIKNKDFMPCLSDNKFLTLTLTIKQIYDNI